MRRSAFLAAALSAFAFTAVAAEFGPRTYRRTGGPPQTIVETFQRKVECDRYELVLTSARVTAAWGWLNGTPVFTPSDFSGKIESLRRHVPLAGGRNELRVQIAGSPDAEMTIRIAAVLGASGGTISVANGPSFSIPAGALSGDAEVDLRGIPLQELAAPRPSGYGILGAVELDLGGATLASPGRLSIPVAAQNLRRPIVSKVIPFENAPRLTLIDTASVAGNRLQTNSPPFPGIRSGGSYVAMDMPSDLGIVGINTAQGGTWISVLQTTITSGASAAVIASSLESAGAFLGISDANGLAVIPGVLPGSRITAIATTPGAASVDVASVPIPSLPDIVTDGFAAGWLHQWLLERAFDIDPNELPSPPASCPCAMLLVDPARIPRNPNTVFAPRQIEPLHVACGPNDVTGSRQLDIPSFLDGASAGITLYNSDASVASVGASGNVRGESPGSTHVDVWSSTVQLHNVRIPRTSLQIALPFACSAYGRVDPVTVTCPPSVPHWDGAESRCEAQIAVSIAGTGSGSVASSPAGIANCRSTCMATFVPGTVVTLTATPDRDRPRAGLRRARRERSWPRKGRRVR